MTCKWLITVVIVSPLTGVVGPLPNGLFMAYKQDKAHHSHHTKQLSVSCCFRSLSILEPTQLCMVPACPCVSA